MEQSGLYYLEVRDGVIHVRGWDQSLDLASHQHVLGGPVESVLAWSWNGSEYADAISYVNADAVELDLARNCYLDLGDGRAAEVSGPLLIIGLREDEERGLTPEEVARFQLVSVPGVALPVLRSEVELDEREQGEDNSDRSLREQRICEGILVDLSAPPFAWEAEQLGYNVPIAMTRRCFDRYVRITATASRGEEEEHLIVYDMLHMLRKHLDVHPTAQDSYVSFTFLAMMPNGERSAASLLASVRRDTDGSAWMLIGCEDER